MAVTETRERGDGRRMGRGGKRKESGRKKNERDKFNNINTLCGLLLKTVRGKGKKITIIELDVCEGVVVRATLKTADREKRKKGKIVTLHRVFFVLTIILSFSQNLSKGLKEGKNNEIKHSSSHTHTHTHAVAAVIIVYKL